MFRSIKNGEEHVAKAWRSVCIAHGVRCLADRSWSFFLPLYLARMCGNSSLRPTAAVSIVQSVAVATLSTAAANWYRRRCARCVEEGYDPAAVFAGATILENLAVALGGVLTIAFASGGFAAGHGMDNELMPMETDSDRDVLCSKPLHSCYFILVLACAAADATLSSLLSMIISKEWVAVLSQASVKSKIKEMEGANGIHIAQQRRALARANAILSQIDLFVAAASPLLVSFAIRHLGGYNVTLAALVSQHLVGAVILVSNARRALRFCPQLAPAASTPEREEHHTHADEDGTGGEQYSLLEGITTLFCELPIKTMLVVVAYVLLYFTVLSPGPVLNAWLNSSRHLLIDENVIAYFGSASQLCGVLATIVAPRLILLCGSLNNAGVISQCLQTICVLFGAMCFFRMSRLEHQHGGGPSSPENVAEAQTLLLGFLLSIGASRIGLWTFDLVERQMLQELVPRSRQTLLFNAERGATQIASLGMMYMCYSFPHPSSFGLLVTLSTVSVCCASILLLFAAHSSPTACRKTSAK